VTQPVSTPPAGRPVLSVCLCDAASGAVFVAEDADLQHSTASIGKILLLAEVAVRFVDGRLSRGEPLTRTAEDAVADSGLWQHLATDTLSAADCAALIGAVSDNLATNVLLRRVGLVSVTERGRTIGLSRTALLDRVRDVRRPSDPPALSVGTARELAELIVMLHHGQVRSRAVSRQVLDWLALDTDTSMVAGALGLDPLAHTDPDRGMSLAHKTGTSTGIRADVGLAGGPAGSVAYAVLATFHDRDRDRVLADMFRVGERVRRHIAG
jgi:beta-lactamase class A